METPTSPPGENLLGLTEVDPSPVEETPVEFKGDYFGSASSPSPPPGTARTSALGLGNHGLAYYLTRIQRYSSYTFSAFASLHILNTSIIPLFTRSVPSSEPYLLLTRPAYQTALTEPLLVLLPVATHVASGIALRFHRRSIALRRYGAESHSDRKHIPWPPISGTSKLGYALVPLLAFHMFAARGLPVYVHGDSALINLSYISHGFALHPVISTVGFVAMITVGVPHVVWGWARWLGVPPTKGPKGSQERAVTKKRRWYQVNAIVAAVATLWMAGGLGVVGRAGKVAGWVGREYDDLYRSLYRSWPILGRWA